MLILAIPSSSGISDKEGMVSDVTFLHVTSCAMFSTASKSDVHSFQVSYKLCAVDSFFQFFEHFPLMIHLFSLLIWSGKNLLLESIFFK